MTDIFDEIEGAITGWVSRHPLASIIILKWVCIWIILSICVVSMTGVVGMSMVSVNITEQHDAGVGMDDDAYGIWEGLLLPICVKMFDTMEYIIYAIIIAYIYFVIRCVYKYKKE